jgi:hypothetical protein
VRQAADFYIALFPSLILNYTDSRTVVIVTANRVAASEAFGIFLPYHCRFPLQLMIDKAEQATAVIDGN